MEKQNHWKYKFEILKNKIIYYRRHLFVIAAALAISFFILTCVNIKCLASYTIPRNLKIIIKINTIFFILITCYFSYVFLDIVLSTDDYELIDLNDLKKSNSIKRKYLVRKLGQTQIEDFIEVSVKDEDYTMCALLTKEKNKRCKKNILDAIL